MSTPPQNPAGDAPTPRFDDATRNIRLPSLPDRAPSVVRPEWQAHVPPAVADPLPAPAEQTPPESGDASKGTAAVPATRFPEPAPSRPYVLPNEPTDEMSSPPRVRQHTLAFDASAGARASGPGHGSPGPGFEPGRSRRWPWVVLTVLPILVIVGAGLLLLFLLRGA